MKVHLESIRRFYPAAPIMISKRGGGLDEMEYYRRTFSVQYQLEECTYVDALLRLVERCPTEYVCILDHDTVLLSSLDQLLNGLAEGHYDLVGVEERIRLPDMIWKTMWPETDGWLRLAPGYMDATFLMFNLECFLCKWGLRGLVGKGNGGAATNEFHYGVCEKLNRHRYLQPFHLPKYGIGNLLKDGETAVLWHQWYGSYRTRLLSTETAFSISEDGERAFLNDYPQLDVSGLAPAWGPQCYIDAQIVSLARRPTEESSSIRRGPNPIRLWRSYGLHGVLSRASNQLERWWRLR